MVSQNYFDKITGIVIDKLEGGYFHPDMRNNNPSKFGGYGNSGETLFGLDRFAGHGLFYKTKRKSDNVNTNMKYIYDGSYEYKTPEAKEFWTTIDNADARKNWDWLYRGGKNEEKLKKLASRIIYPSFNSLSKKYLNSESEKALQKDPRLLFNFIYATWNGSGWFKKFAEKLNVDSKKGYSKDVLLQKALDYRINSGNSLIKQGGEKIKGFINEIDFPSAKSEDITDDSGSGSLKTLLFVSLLLVGGFLLYRRFK